MAGRSGAAGIAGPGEELTRPDLKGRAARFILGTAQFGLDYGITNELGKVDLAQARDILSAAHVAGVPLVDTAAAYGTSEALLGQCSSEFAGLGVITKIRPQSVTEFDAQNIKALRADIVRSMELLGRDRLDGLLVHQAGDLLKPGGRILAGLLMELKAEGLVSSVGVSVYDASEIDRILSFFRPDIVQVPLNILDQRLLKSGHIAGLRNSGVEVHARSAFLQGVLLSRPATLPDYFRQFDHALARYWDFLARNSISALSACLDFMMKQGSVDYVVVGVVTKAELTEILNAPIVSEELPSMSDLASEALALIDPRLWPKRASGLSS